MQLQVISIGQKMPQWVELACDDYAKRLPRELNLQWLTLPLASRKTGSISIEKLKDQEAAQIKQKMLPGSFNLAFDEQGKQWPSQEWSLQLKSWMQNHPRVNFIIGGPDGLSQSLMQGCNQRVSLGRMTLPHALVRVVLVEQIYRAWTILNGHPYHRQ